MKIPRNNSDILKQALIYSIFLYSLAATILGINFTGGAKYDFFNFHFPSVDQFISFDFIDATKQLNSASGPLFYYLMSLLGTVEIVRVASVAFFFLGAFFLWSGTKNLGLSTPWLALAYLASSFNISNATWALPEAFSLFLIIVAWKIKNVSLACESLFFALSVFTRQTMILPAIYRYLTQAIEEKKPILITYIIPSVLIGGFLFSVWGGFTPPRFSHHSSFRLRVFLISYACFAIYFIPAALSSYQKNKEIYLKNKFIPPILFLLLVVAWTNSTPVDSGGFIFSRVDAFSNYGSPALITAILYLTIPIFHSHKSLALAFLIASAGFSLSGIFYLKYVDNMLFAILLSSRNTKHLNEHLLRSIFITEALLTLLSVFWQGVRLNVGDILWSKFLIQ